MSFSPNLLNYCIILILSLVRDNINVFVFEPIQIYYACSTSFSLCLAPFHYLNYTHQACIIWAFFCTQKPGKEFPVFPSTLKLWFGSSCSMYACFSYSSSYQLFGVPLENIVLIELITITQIVIEFFSSAILGIKHCRRNHTFYPFLIIAYFFISRIII